MSTGPDLRILSRAEATPRADVPRPRPRWATRVALPVLIVALTAGVLAYSSRDLIRPAVPVRVAPAIPAAGGAAGPASSGRGPAVVQAPGWVEPEPYAITVPALAEGVVREVLVLEGERVEAGQVVARLVDDEARLAARAAEALRAEREAQVERARAAVATAEAQARVERAALDELRDEVERKRGLVESGAISPGEHRRLQIRLGGLEARLLTAERAVDEARAGLRAAEAALASARVEQEAALLRLSRMEVRSPAAGVVLTRLVWPGVHVSTASMREGDTGRSGGIVRLYQPGSLQARVDVPLADAARVGPGCRAEVVTEALPDTPIEGVVTRVVHEANIQRNTVQFKVALRNPPAVLKPEMLVRVRLFGSGEADAGSAAGAPAAVAGVYLVPARAVRWLEDGRGEAWVIAAGPRGWVAKRRLLTGAPDSDPQLVAVTSGLTLTERVIVDPPAGLSEGRRVRVVEDPPPRGSPQERRD